MQIEGLAITLELDDNEIPGWLPLLPDRFAVESAYRRALGFTELDESVPSGRTSEPDFGAVLCAAVGLCWGGDPLELVLHSAQGPSLVLVPPGPRALRSFDRDVIAFGDAVCDALVRLGYSVSGIYDCGRLARQAMVDSIPTQGEVDAAAGFTGPTGADSTTPTSK